MVIGALAFFSFHTWSLGFGLVPIVAVLLVVGWAISLFVMGLVLRFGTGAEALAWGVMFVLLPLSGVFYPTEALPTVLQPIALALPTTHAFTALRSLVDGNGSDWGQTRDRGGRLGRDARARDVVPRRDAARVPQARLHHPLHLIRRGRRRTSTRPSRPGRLAIRRGGDQAVAGTLPLHSRLSLYW